MPFYFGFTMQDVIDANLLAEYNKGGKHKEKVELQLSRPLLDENGNVIDKEESEEYMRNNELPKHIVKNIKNKYK